MRKIAIVSGLVFILSCQSTYTRAPCDYFVGDLKKLNKPPKTFVTEINENYTWFEKANGNYFACADLKSKNYCYGYYEEFKLNKRGKYDFSEIVCID